MKHTEGRIIVMVDIAKKDSYDFGNGKLILLRDTENFDRRYTQPVNGIVISAEAIPQNSEVLLEHNATHDTNRIFELDDENNPDIRYFSVPEQEVYVWRTEIKIKNPLTPEEVIGLYDTTGILYFKQHERLFTAWQPTKFYAIGEKVFKPYKGTMQNIEPELIKNTLLIRSGEFKNKIVHVLPNSGYIIIYQDENGKPAEILTTFHVEDSELLENDEQLAAKQEIVCVNETLTEQWLNGELLTGLYANKADPIKELTNDGCR